jgi:hypothetical protein
VDEHFFAPGCAPILFLVLSVTGKRRAIRTFRVKPQYFVPSLAKPGSDVHADGLLGDNIAGSLPIIFPAISLGSDVFTLALGRLVGTESALPLWNIEQVFGDVGHSDDYRHPISPKAAEKKDADRATTNPRTK